MTPSRFRSVLVYVHMGERLLWRVGATDMSSTRGPGTAVPCSQLNFFFSSYFPRFYFCVDFFLFLLLFSVIFLLLHVSCHFFRFYFLFLQSYDGEIKHSYNLPTGTSFHPWSWWRHQMETFSALLAICAGIHRSLVNFPHKGQWRGALMFSFICVWINAWVNNRKAGDLRRYRAYYDVTVMMINYTSNVFWT